LFLNNYVYGLGIKIVDEALLLSYFAIGAVIALLIFYNSSIVKKTFISFEKLLSMINETFRDVEEKTKKGRELANKTQHLLTYQTGIFDNIHSLQKNNYQNIKNKLQQTQKSFSNLEQELKHNEMLCQELTEQFDNFEKSCQSVHDLERPSEELSNIFDQLQENIFKEQLLSFNASVEAVKGLQESAATTATATSTSGPLPALTKEIENIAKQNSLLLKDVQSRVESINGNIHEIYSDHVLKVLELSRYVAKMLFHFNKFSSQLKNFNSFADQEEIDQDQQDLSKNTQSYYHEGQNLYNTVKELCTSMNTITAITPNSALFSELKNVGINTKISEITKTSSSTKTSSAHTSATTTAATPAATATTATTVAVAATGSATNVVEVTENRRPSTELIEEVIKQNISALYSISPLQLKKSIGARAAANS
ncbi:MAG: hypothetical protein HQK53_19215, partial [Oligoflexia bacterium]|nr:hypothetical protein [Oligoflexia bacterium]